MALGSVNRVVREAKEFDSSSVYSYSYFCRSVGHNYSAKIGHSIVSSSTTELDPAKLDQ